MNPEINLGSAVLESERLILRPWREDDLDDLFEYASMEGLGPMSGWPEHKNREESRQLLSFFMTSGRSFAIEYRENHKVIGDIGIKNYIEDRLGEEYRPLRGQELGYALNRDYWGRGLMPEAVARVIGYCFNELCLDFLTCGHFTDNRQSRRVIEKAGFEYLNTGLYVTQTGEQKEEALYVLRRSRFSHELACWDDWCKYFSDLPAYRDIAKDIFARNSLDWQEPAEMPLGTNVVMRVGDKVLKLYVPKEAEYDSEKDYLAELGAMSFAAKQDIATPRVYAAGQLFDRYLWRYIVMELLPGESAEDALPAMSEAEKAALALRLRALLDKMNKPTDCIAPCDLIARAENRRSNGFIHPALAAELIARAKTVDISSPVLVHGDVTNENVLIADGVPQLIDFADCSISPASYELVGLVFELFQFDKAAVAAFRGSEDREHFLKRLIDGLSLHEYAGNCIRDFLGREGIEVMSVDSLEKLEKIIKDRLN